MEPLQKQKDKQIQVFYRRGHTNKTYYDIISEIKLINKITCYGGSEISHSSLCEQNM